MNKWIRSVGIQKAYPYTEKRLLSWTPPYIVQPKLDGDRCRVIIDEFGKVTLLSSEANDIWAVPKIKKELSMTGLRNIELDGELYRHKIPQAVIHGIVSSKRVELHPEHTKVKLMLFDLIHDTLNQKQRLYLLNKVYLESLKLLSTIRIVPFYIVTTLEEIGWLLEVFIKKGYEGFIIRKIDAPYRRTRSIYMMKFKPSKNDVYEIVDVNEAIDIEGNPKGMVGSFQCSAKDKLGTFPVSAGNLKHDERIMFWEARNELKGKLILVDYQHLTSKNGLPRSGFTVRILDDDLGHVH